MAINAGLINAQIPMSAANSVPQIDGAQDAYKGYTMKGNMVKQDAEVSNIRDEQADKGLLKDYLGSGGDLATPDGSAKALEELKGKVSPTMYSKLIDHDYTMKQHDAKLKKDLSETTAENLKIRSTQLDQTMAFLGQPLKAYEESAKTKGEPAALADFAKSRDQILAQAAQAKGADGKPIYPPDILAQMANADPQTLKGMMSTTTWHKAQVDEALKASQIKRNEALASYDDERAKVAANGGGGTPTELAKIDRDVANGVISAEQGQAMKAGIVAKKSSPGDVSGLSSDAINNVATDYYLHGTLPARLGAAERTKILNRAADIAKENGDTAEEASTRKVANKSATMGVNDLTKRMALTSAFERDADKRLGLILELSKKADQSGIPALNRWINAGRVNIEGDIDVNNLNSALISAQAELAKVLSGSLGNAAVSDSARQEAQTIINKNMTEGQIDSLVPNIRREMKYKLDSWKEEIDELKGSMQTPNTQRDRATRAANKISPEDQAKKDSDGAAILKRELASYRAELAKIPNTPDTADKHNRKQADIDGVIRELHRMGVTDVDAPAAATGGIPSGWSVKVK